MTVGDWYDNTVEAAEHDDPRATLAVIVHELIEYVLCAMNGISAAEVDEEDWKMLCGKKKYNQLCYWRFHLKALAVERAVINALGLSWPQHEKLVEKAYRKQEKLVGATK